MIQFERHGIRWEVPTACEPLLDQLLTDSGRAIKVTPTKLVTVHEMLGRTYYVKRYQNTRVPLRPLKFFFKPSEARTEWNIAQRYHALGIPLVHHVALGERWTATGLQESLLITEGYAGVPLSKTDIHQTEPVQIELARLLRLMHDRGVLQPDLHHNILVRAEPLELRRIDVDRGEIKAALTDDERSDNLAWLSINVPLSNKFFEVYGAETDFVRRTRERSDAMRRESRAKYSWRSVGDNLRFEPKKLGGLKWWVRKESFNAALQRVLENPEQPTDRFAVRRFEPRTWSQRFGESPARRAHRLAYHLELLGLPTPRSIAAAERRTLRALSVSYLVTETIPGATDLGTHLRTAHNPSRDLVRRVAELLAQLHEEGFSHGKLNETGIVRDPTDKVYLADLDGLNYLKEVTTERALTDLNQFAQAVARYTIATQNRRFAFLRAYIRTRKIKGLFRAARRGRAANSAS